MSHIPGVYVDCKKDGTRNYRASFTYQNKHISLGSYETALDAGNAYQFAHQIMDDSTFTVSNYSSKFTLLYDKYISLINLRDNKIYISNPIYLYRHYFVYHLSPKIDLKFDMDDLFYFSSHKIIKRGNHLFVSDYGMQQTIHYRFGIRSYSVPGRDYLFINGDSNDLRRENIQIINRFMGVRRYLDGVYTRYKSVIHVNGDIIIGTYSDELEAAIAYNKAIDILLANGIKKEYTPNYIEDISPKEYASIYSALIVSKKLYHAKI